MAFNDTAAFSIFFFFLAQWDCEYNKTKDFLIQLNIKIHGSNTFFKGVEIMFYFILLM